MNTEEKVFSLEYKNRLISIDTTIKLISKENRTIAYFPGLGCSKKDILGIFSISELSAFNIISINHPGVGKTSYQPKLSTISDIVNQIALLFKKIGLRNITMIGHSFGGIIALLLENIMSHKINAFINIEGNLTPEDCIFTRNIVEYSLTDFKEKYYPELLQKLTADTNPGMKQYSLALKKQSSLEVIYNYSKEIVYYSDNSKLFDKFINLRKPKIFIYGAENRRLSYLEKLRANCEVAEIEKANHFPFHDNPHQFYKVISRFILKNNFFYLTNKLL